CYRKQLDSNRLRGKGGIGADRLERETLTDIDKALIGMKKIAFDRDRFIEDMELERLTELVHKLNEIVSNLPSHLHRRLHGLVHGVRAQYRTGITLAWVTLVASGILLIVTSRMFHLWIAKPLDILVKGSREVASGKYEHRVHLEGDNE